MARAHGARAQMALAFETVYGTAPASGYRTVPFASTTLGAEQPLLASELLGQGRDPLAPIKDAVTADGDVVVPIDVENGDFSGGALDPTVGPLVKLWNIGSDDPRVPSPAELKAALPLVNWKDAAVDDAAGTVFLKRAGIVSIPNDKYAPIPLELTA